MTLHVRRSWRWIVLFGFLLLILGRGVVFRALVGYEIVNERPVQGDVFPGRTFPVPREATMEDCLYFAQQFAADELVFARNATTIHPGDMYPGCRTHCVGFAALCAAVGQQVTARIYPGNESRIRHVVCRIRILGIDIHQWISDPFFRDHDAVLLVSGSGTPELLVDPVLYDMTGITCVSWIQP